MRLDNCADGKCGECPRCVAEEEAGAGLPMHVAFALVGRYRFGLQAIPCDPEVDYAGVPGYADPVDLHIDDQWHIDRD